MPQTRVDIIPAQSGKLLYWGESNALTPNDRDGDCPGGD